MEHQKLINLLGNKTTQPSKFRTKKWVEINNESCGEYCAVSQFRFKPTMLRLSLCNYSDVCILVKGAITITGDGDDEQMKANERQADATDCCII